jgi:hypothetical protein
MRGSNKTAAASFPFEQESIIHQIHTVDFWILVGVLNQAPVIRIPVL